MRVGTVRHEYIRIYYVSAFIKVGTVAPIITPIFQNYVDIIRRRVTKYIYFSQNRTLNATVGYSSDNPLADVLQFLMAQKLIYSSTLFMS